MSFSKKIIAGVAAVATLAALAPAVAMAEGDAPATQQQTQNEVKIFNVMVHANGGTFTSGNNTGQAGDYMVTVQDGGSLVSALPQVQRDGYLFAGWSYDKDGKSPVVATDFVSAYTEVYAQWTKQKPVVDAKQFNVTVSTNGGTIADGDHKGEAGDIQVSAAQDSVLVNALPTVTREGYTFAGWSYDKDGKSPVVATDFVSANTVVYAQWVKKVEEAQFFNVKVNSNGGTFIDGTDAGCAGDTMVSVKKDGSLVSALPQVQRDGYLFAGWSYDKDGKSPVVATDFVSAYTEVYAQWTKQKPVVDAKQFNVTVSTNGGTIADGDHKGEAGDIQVSAAQDSVLVNALPTVTREGYTFAGWSYDKDGNSKVLDTDFVSANTWVYAQWQEVTKFNVIANTNGGYFANGTTAGDAMVEAVEDGANLVDSLKGEEFPFVRPGYTFAGWSYDKDGNSKVLDTDFVSANTWVYAQWQEVTKFNVIANTNGGYFANGTTAGDAMVEAVEDGANLVDSLKGEEFPFVRPGYTFAGWSYDKDGNSKVLDTDFVSANTFVYAQWTKADDSKKDDSKPADTTKKNDTKGNTKKTVAQKIKKAVLGNTGATVGGVAVFAVIALLGFAGITVLRKRA
ncbi:hypothetical protein DW119_03990 [Bifidobacterium pseudocatenulatum]|uniref:InlB B-repeat-containing protein n=8 Tax=Bifidobacterium pseudocatenulatum TaxID=28026 RepID=UPI000E4CF1FE|nr:InlB B-repeat-containing protein [Bifidobacterium pseudocatenulatum]RHJ49418.1 hypothetical protein DW119_03990 [Bifidobacterium pseudocatenulatum]